ncbi:MAG: hypothetical protein QG653_490, partial [Patescibacteria group bacterium]|nr:hypothetical protein [Patescibacteria group bacterium]
MSTAFAPDDTPPKGSHTRNTPEGTHPNQLHEREAHEDDDPPPAPAPADRRREDLAQDRFDRHRLPPGRRREREEHGPPPRRRLQQALTGRDTLWGET